MCEHEIEPARVPDFLANPLPYRHNVFNGERVAKIVLNHVTNATGTFSLNMPSTYYNPTSSAIFHKPFGEVAVLCACGFLVSFFCFWPCLIVRGFCAKRLCKPREHVTYIPACGFGGWCWSFSLQLVLAGFFFFFLIGIGTGLMGVVVGGDNTLLDVKHGLDCASTWVEDTNNTVVQLFNQTFSFVNNQGGTLEVTLGTLSQQLWSLKTNFTSAATQFDTSCNTVRQEYPKFADRLDCPQIKAAFNIDTLTEDINKARSRVAMTVSSIQDAIRSARSAIHGVENEVFDATSAAQKFVQKALNYMFAQGQSVLPALPSIPLLYPHGLSAHEGLERWVSALTALATTVVIWIVFGLGLPAVVGLCMLLGGNCCMLTKYCRKALAHYPGLSSAHYPLLHTDSLAPPRDVHVDRAEHQMPPRAALGTRNGTTFGAVGYSPTINMRLDRNAGKPCCVSVCCARAGCCIIFVAAASLFCCASVWFATLGIFGSMCDVVLLPTTEGLSPGLLQLEETLGKVVVPSVDNINVSVTTTCFSSTSLLPALGIDVSREFIEYTKPLLREANLGLQIIATLSGPAMAKAKLSLDLASATLSENEMPQLQLEFLAQACQQCNITQWRATVVALDLEVPCGRTSTKCNTTLAYTCQTEFCRGKLFGMAANALIDTTRDDIDRLQKYLALVNATLRVGEDFAAALPATVHNFVDVATRTANSITCSFVEVAYARLVGALCGTAIDGYQAAANCILYAAVVLSFMVSVQIFVNIRLGGVGSGAPPVCVYSENLIEETAERHIQLGTPSTHEKRRDKV